ncbi:hypothetical protein [Actinomycetospora cinnamomea]|uniref:hypothetical protein n=1 Tax=Actinomycetospora cinnamomea TaxID=663609 RepID=UPI0014029BF4|nr:hypothetical protein [Actinomycetospora cinnamomea]
MIRIEIVEFVVSPGHADDGRPADGARTRPDVDARGDRGPAGHGVPRCRVRA